MKSTNKKGENGCIVAFDLVFEPRVSRGFKEQIDRDDEYGGRKCRRFYDSHG